MSNRLGLVGGVRSEGYLAHGAVHHMLEMDLCGPVKAASTDKLLSGWGKADMDKLKERLSNVNWREIGEGLGAVAEWDRFKDILEEEVNK